MNILTAVNDFLRDAYARVPDPSLATWPRALVRLAVANAAQGRPPEDCVQIAAVMVGGLAADARAELEAEIQIPANVLAFLAAADPVWPAQTGAIDWQGLDPLALDAYRAQAVNSLRRALDHEAQRVVPGDPRMLLTQAMQVIEAGRVIDAGADALAAPHVEGYRQGKGLAALPDAAAAIMGRAAGWGAANAAIEAARHTALDAIALAPDAAAVDAAVDTATATTRAIVDGVLGV